MHFDAAARSIIILRRSAWSASAAATSWRGSASAINTFANSRTAFASLRGKPFPTYAIPLKAGMSIGMLLISTELLIMLAILLFVPGDYAGPCFIGFAIGESLGAAALRIAGGIFTKIADIGSDLMKIVFNIKEDDARNPGVIADCTGDNAGDSVGPTADGFETYGVTGVALITFILLAVTRPDRAGRSSSSGSSSMRVLMVITSAVSYFINEAVAKARYGNADKMNFEAPLTSLVWLTSILSVGVTFVVSYAPHPQPRRRHARCGGSSRRSSPAARSPARSSRAGEGLHLDRSRHVREVVTASREGGASLNILSGLIAGNFSRLLDGPHHRRPHGHRARGSAGTFPTRRGRADDRRRRRSSRSASWPSASSAWAR